MRLIIARHGQTFDNINKVFRGQGHGQLTEIGLEQTKKLALRLKSLKIDAVYSSDLKRAIDSTKEILKYHQNLKLHLDKRLRERDWGKLDGKPHPKEWVWGEFPNFVETDKSLCERTKDFLDELYQNDILPNLNREISNKKDVVQKSLHLQSKDNSVGFFENNQDKTILVVTHGGIINAFTTIFNNKTYKDFTDIAKKNWTNNTALSEFEITKDGNRKIHYVNCDKHLID